MEPSAQKNFGLRNYGLRALFLILFSASPVDCRSCGVPDSPTCAEGQLFFGSCGNFQKKTACWGDRQIFEGGGKLLLEGNYCCTTDEGECCKADSVPIALLSAFGFLMIIGNK
jgi:hypothetical protein